MYFNPTFDQFDLTFVFFENFNVQKPILGYFKEFQMKTAKTRVSREKKVDANQATTSTETMIPEQTDADAEIRRATEEHEAAERATAEALRVTTQQVIVKPAVEPVKYMTEDAHKQRKLDVANSGLRRYAAEHVVRAYFDKLVAAGRSADQPLTLGEYRSYLFNSQQNGVSVSDRPRMFTEEAFAIVKHLFKSVKEALFKKFDGQTGVGVTDEFLIVVAEATVANDERFSLAIDGAVMNCGNPKCNRRFVPVRGITSNAKGIREFGNFRRVGTQVMGFCSVCKDLAIAEARDSGSPAPWFSSKDFAEKSAKYQEEKRNTTEGLRVAMGTMNRVEHDRRQDSRGGDGRKKAGTFNPELAARCNNPFAALLNNREKDQPTGRYYSPEFDWEDKRSGKTVKTFLDLEVGKWRVVVSDAGPGLESLIDSSHNTGFFENKGLFVAITKAAEAQQK